MDDPGMVLMAAAAAGLRDRVVDLLACGAPVHCRDECGDTPLHCAAEKGHAQIVEILIGAGADLERVSTRSAKQP